MATPLQKLLATVKAVDPFDIPHKRIVWLIEQSIEEEKETLLNTYFQGFREGRGIDNIEVDGKIFYEDTNAERYYSTLSQPNGNCYPKET